MYRFEFIVQIGSLAKRYTSTSQKKKTKRRMKIDKVNETERVV